MKDTPNISPLSAPIAKDKTNKNNKDVINGEKSVWAQTFKNLKTSFTYKVHVPYQLTKPNLLVPILYFFVISTIDSLINLILKKLCKTKSTNSFEAF